MSERLSNSLTALADRVRASNAATEAARRSAIENAFATGALLIEAKAACRHGEWLQFLARAEVEERTAQRYMTLVRSGLEIRHVSDLGGIRAALEHLAGQRQQAAREERLAELLAEKATLAEEAAALEAERDALEATNRFFDDYFLLWQQGGWEAVVAALNEQIRVLKTRVETEVRDKEAYQRRARYFEKQAQRYQTRR